MMNRKVRPSGTCCLILGVCLALFGGRVAAGAASGSGISTVTSPDGKIVVNIDLVGELTYSRRRRWPRNPRALSAGHDAL